MVHYGDVTYSAVGPMMNAENPHVAVDVVCYETTDEEPDWTVKMRHLLLHAAPDGVLVREVLFLDNPSDRTWVGVVGDDEARTTTILPLPPGADSVELGQGFNGWQETTLTDGKLVNRLPLSPAGAEMQYVYRIPIEEGKATLDIQSPHAADRVMVVVPGTMSVESAEGLEFTGERDMGEFTVGTFSAENLAAGAAAQLTLSSVEPVAMVPEEPVSSGGSTGMARMIAIIGGGVVILAAVILIFARAGKAKTS
jgi:hypothetical protein